jgi:hypothetical protein
VFILRLKEIELYVIKFEVFVTVECIEVIPFDRLFHCIIYRDIILLKSHISIHLEHFVWWKQHSTCPYSNFLSIKVHTF